MKTFTLKKHLQTVNFKKVSLLILITVFSQFSNAQNASVDVSVTWPNWSSENRAEIYDPSGILISTIDNGYSGLYNDSYSTTVNLGCIPTGNNYYVVMYDTYGDGWNGASNITINSGGATVLTNSGANASTAGHTLYFNVSGNCSCSSAVNTFPYTESFESGLGLWTQNAFDDFDWTRNNGTTISSGTGPNNASDGTYYMYTEASNNYSNYSYLESPCFDLTTMSSASFSFYYHMYGSSMGTLNVDLSTDGGSTYLVNLWSQTGGVQTSNGAAWNQATIDLSAYLGQTIKIRFSGTTGNNFRSDMSIDDISLTTTSTPQPEIDITGNSISIANGDATPNITDGTDFGALAVAVGSTTNTFTINNLGTLNLNLTGGTPYVTISGTNSADFTLSSTPTIPITPAGSTSFDITFDPTGNGIRTAIITIANNDSDEPLYTFLVEGFGGVPVIEAPGGITANLELWLKANDGAGTTDGQALTTWYDQANSNDATTPNPGQEPTYRDNANYNVNFNPVVDFENDYNNAPIDYTYADTTRDIMAGPSGYYSDDIYVVLIPDINTTSATPSMDIFCADSDTGTQATDGTGIGFGAYSIRYAGEVLSFAHGTTPSGSTPINNRGYGVAQVNNTSNYDNAGIINGRHNTSDSAYELLYNSNNVVNTEVGVPQFGTVNNANYWLGRSEGYKGSLDGRIVELITFSSRNSDGADRDRIESYLAIKYGITLGVNGVSQDYLASDGSTIWDVSANSGYNFDIAGIGRDDDSALNQKQSKSVNHSSIVAMSLSNTELTNNLNINGFSTDREFLIWGNDGNNTNSSATSITVSLGPATITTVTDVMNRKWKINETAGDDVGTVEVSVFDTDLAGLPPLTGNDAYVMLVADDSNFTTSLQTVFLDPSTFNGLATREGTYDFDGTKYFTFGVAHEEVRTRHLGFDGVDNYTLVGDRVDLAGSFTASAWVKPDGDNALATDKTIVAKNNGTTGYKFFVTNGNIVSFSVGTTAADRIDSNTTLPDNVWHHVAVTYNGTTANLYIDGVLDTTKTMTSPTPNGSDFAIGAIYVSKSNIQDFFKGDIDEIRIWDAALTPNQLRYVMNQELEKATTVVNGTIVPNTITKNEIEMVNWTNLLAYYNMNSYIGTHLNDVSGNGNRGSLTDPDQFTLEYQSSPLPYNSLADGDWNDNLTWQNGGEQYIPGSASIVDPNITVDWNIVRTNHNITIDNTANLPTVNRDNRTVLSLMIDTNKIEVVGDNATDTGNGLTVTHYLSIDGKLDLQGESQLIQTTGSDFNPASSGTLERDQQGTQDLFTYNYWSSPVGVTNTTTNNNSYTVPDIFNDGTNPNAPGPINFITTGYDGTQSPLGIADFWIWKYSNDATSYYNWQHVRSTGTLLAGEGFSMKGVNNTSGNVSLEQNYVLEGKPNNGDITLPITAGNSYLVGNPYASAIDAHQFILDNAPVIENAGATNGTLYFWEHWGGGTHNTAEYQGGYATYNLSGAVPAATLGNNTLGSGGTPTKLPGRYIAVAQGFFVGGEATGDIVFNNGQRVFQKEDVTNSIFVRNTENNTNATIQPPVTPPDGDTRLKIRLGFHSVNTMNRQILVTADPYASLGVDYGYDGEQTETQMDDMYWMIDSKKYVIQGVDTIEDTTVLPLGIHTNINGNNTFRVDELINAPSDLEVYIYDTVTELYHDIKTNDFSINLDAGEYLDRFELRFSNANTLSVDDIEISEDIAFYFANNNETIVIENPKLETIKSVELFNILGQSILKFDNETKAQELIEFKTNGISTGSYILELKTETGKLSKKVLIE